MSWNTKTYVPRCTAKEVSFPNGGSIIRLSFHADSLLEFIKTNKSDKGFLTLNLSKRKEVGTYGDTHYLTLDTWKPKEGDTRAQETTAPSPVTKPAAQSPVGPEDDVPF